MCSFPTSKHSASRLSDMTMTTFSSSPSYSSYAHVLTCAWLDLGTCPWELMRRLLPELTGLCVIHLACASFISLVPCPIVPWCIFALRFISASLMQVGKTTLAQICAHIYTVRVSV